MQMFCPKSSQNSNEKIVVKMTLIDCPDGREEDRREEEWREEERGELEMFPAPPVMPRDC